MTDEMLTEWGMKLLVPAFIGTLGLFLALGFGFLGYMIKVFLQWQMEK